MGVVDVDLDHLDLPGPLDAELVEDGRDHPARAAPGRPQVDDDERPGVDGGVEVGIPGLDFALTSFFLVLAMEAFRVRREIPGPVVALLCALLAQLIAGDGVLLVAMGLFVAYLLVRYFWSRRSRIA